MELGQLRQALAEAVHDPRGVDVRTLTHSSGPDVVAVYYPGRDAFVPFVITLRPTRGKDAAYVNVQSGHLMTPGMALDLAAIVQVVARWWDGQPAPQVQGKML